MKLLPILLALTFGLRSYPQPPVMVTSWVNKIQPGIYELQMFVAIKDGWHIYSIHPSKDTLNFATRISFFKNTAVSHLKLEEYGHKEIFDDTTLRCSGWGYKDNVMFVDRVVVKNRGSTQISADFLYFAGDGIKDTYSSTYHMIFNLE